MEHDTGVPRKTDGFAVNSRLPAFRFGAAVPDDRAVQCHPARPDQRLRLPPAAVPHMRKEPVKPQSDPLPPEFR